MDPAFQEKYYRIERDHAWSVARRDILLRVLEKSGVNRSARIVEFGCSGGLLLDRLRHSGYTSTTGVEASEAAVALCNDRGIANVMTTDDARHRLAPASFDCVIASDVLEHIEDERAALAEWNRLLTSHGKLVIFVPAFSMLWSRHDVINQHYRRYTLWQLTERVQAAGFVVEDSGYWNWALFFPTAAARVTASIRAALMPPSRDGEDDRFAELRPGLNAIVREWMLLENRMMARGARFPLGMSTWVLASKSQESRR
jgi:SAM-dependent methyltransferase